MKKSLKKLVVMMLTMVLLVAVLSISAFAVAEGTCANCGHNNAHDMDWPNSYADKCTEYCWCFNYNPHRHNQNGDTIAAVAPTCTDTGLSEGKKCTCGEIVVAQVEVPATGHNQNGDTISGYDATCTTDGLSDGKKCTCGETVVAQTTIPAAHNPAPVGANDETCTADGNIAHFQCTACSKLFEEEACTTELAAADVVIPAAHKPVSVEAKAETCTVNGNIAHFQCSACSKLFLDETCAKELSADAVVIKCGHIPGTPVKDEKDFKDATCTEDGYYYMVTYCVRGLENEVASISEDAANCGGDELSRVKYTVKATDHAWDEGKITKAPTATTKGEKTYICKNDPNHIKVESLAATGTGTLDNVPKTGDASAFFMFGGMMIVALFGAVISFTAKKRNET